MLAHMLFTWLSYYGGVGLDTIQELVYVGPHATHMVELLWKDWPRHYSGDGYYGGVGLDAIQEMVIMDGSA